jgi:tRNA (guanine-N7-)-methyltransferase
VHLRPKPWARPELEASPIFIPEPWEKRGSWNTQYLRPKQPLYLELGCGKGGFISQMAAEHPQNNYLAVDMIDTVLGLARRKIVAAAGCEAPDNIRITAWDIARLEAILGGGDRVQGIYINFCNPWPRHRQHKKRLTHPRQLAQYRCILVSGGTIRFKTDDDQLFNDSLTYFESSGFRLTTVIRDLAATPLKDDVSTEHEAMFSKQGIPIKCVEAKMVSMT